MRVLFVHQNMPGQFGRLAASLAADPRHQVAFITRRSDRDLPGVLRVTYELRTPPWKTPAPLGSRLAVQALFGEAVVEACRALLARGFKPDVIVGHPGWGELLFLKDLLPDTPLVNYCEFYHRPDAPYFGGDPPQPLSSRERMERRAESAHLLLSLEAADRGWSPTEWQRSGHPAAYREKIEVIFDGVDTDRLCPDPGATFTLADGRELRKEDEVLTYAARSLEPCRGLPTFMRALPALLRARPNLQVIIAGDDRPHYDAPPPDAPSWVEKLQREVPIDHSRVHLVGRLAHAQFVKLLQVSRLHVYLTTPIVLSWSMVEAMSLGCTVLASNTPPVREMIIDGENGFLTPFDDQEALCDAADRLLRSSLQEVVPRAARTLVEQRLSLRICLPRQKAFLESLAM